MNISRINSQQSINSKALYFTKIKPVFNKDVKLIDESEVKLSKTGVKYIEDNNIPESLKKRFKEVPFIKDLSEKFDTFVLYKKDTQNSVDKHSDIAFISWADKSKSYATEVVTYAGSEDTLISTMNLFDKLEKGKFLNMSL